MKYTVDTIRDAISKDGHTSFIYFWGHTPNAHKITAACLSQWYDCHFEVDNVLYHTTEQYMMASKALLFGDTETFSNIMAASSPADYKKMGREVRNFNAATWDAKKMDIVIRGNMAKFAQNPHLKEFLLSTGEAVLAEASPYDKIWGIGIDREHAEKGGIELWQGENLLGCALMEVRDRLRHL